MFRYAALAFCLAVLPVFSHAGFFDGNKLQQMSEADDRVAAVTAIKGDQWKSAQLSGYVVGVFDFSENSLCGTEHAKVGQMVAIVKKYLAQHPEQWARSGDDIVFDAFKSAFPCARK